MSALSPVSKKTPGIRFIDDPMSEMKTAARNAPSDLYVWINGDVLAASPKMEFLQRVAASAKTTGASQYAEDSFRSRIADIYHDGAGFIIAADLRRFIAESKGDDAKTNSALDKLGVTNLKYFIAEMKRRLLTCRKARKKIESGLDRFCSNVRTMPMLPTMSTAIPARSIPDGSK